MFIATQFLIDKGFKILPIYGITQRKNGSLICSCELHENCSSPGKHPITSNGVNGATDNMHIVQHWLKKYPNANFAVATGEVSGVMVIDVDYNAGGLQSLEHMPDMSNTWRCKTGNGHHVYYQYREGIGNKVGIYNGIDIRSTGGYVLVPPSLHYSGRYYSWVKQTFKNKLAQIDDNLFELILTKAKDVQDCADCDMMIPEGRRNKALHYFGSIMRGRGFSMAAIAAALREENRIKCSPPLTDDELSLILSSISQYHSEGNGLGLWY